MLDKIFVDKQTGEQVKILNEDVNFYALDNSVRIKKDIFHKKYEEKSEIDPNMFFQPKHTSNPLANIADQIMNLDTSRINDSNAPATQVKYTPPVVIADSSLPPGASVKQPQSEAPIILSPEEKKMMLENWRRTQPGAQVLDQPKNWDEEENNQLNNETVETPIKPLIKETKIDPLQMMFKMFKSNYPVSIKIVIDEKIPNPTFISMVQENVEGDAVEYYAKLISDKFLSDPSKLKSEIYKQLKEVIDNELQIVPKVEKKPQVRKAATKNTPKVTQKRKTSVTKNNNK